MPVAGTQALSAAPAQQERPNILFILFEDMSPRVGAFGDPLAVTPNFDKLAAEGVRYPNTFTTAGVCAPSRASLATGVHQMSMGGQHMRTHNPPPFAKPGVPSYAAVPPKNVKAYPELLRANGYYTSNNFKNDYQFGEPFTVWDESSMKADWRGRAKGQPFFAMFTLMSSHESFLWPIEREPRDRLETFMFKMIKQATPGRKFFTDPAKVTVPPYYPDNIEVRKAIARQYDNIAYTDTQLGKIIEKLKSDGLYDKTIIVVSTDHGDGLPRAKRTLYDSGLKVPLVIRYPDGRGAGTVDERLVSFVDLTKTFLSWTGTSMPNYLNGQVFAGPEKEAPRQYIFAQQDRMDEIVYRYRAVRGQRYKYIRNYNPGQPYFQHSAFRGRLPMMKSLWAAHEAKTLPPAAEAMFQPISRDQLFDTKTDPYEVNNLAGKPEFKTIQTRLEAALDGFMATHVDKSIKSEADMIADMWPGGEQPVSASPKAKFAGNKTGSLITLTAGNNAASIGYKIAGKDGKEEKRWQLYTHPISMPSGTRLRAKAIRYGYKESPVVEATVP